MSKCPYTWFTGFFRSPHKQTSPHEPANSLFVRVVKQGTEVVRVQLPAQSARWLINLIPEDVVEKIRAEKIPLDELLETIQTQKVLYPASLFTLHEEHREVSVWLE